MVRLSAAVIAGVLLLTTFACAKPYLPVRATAPPAVGASETFEGAGGTPLYARSWRPAQGEPRAVLVIMHGLRDHGDRYAGLAAELVRRGIAVWAFDLRGHGRSSGRRVTIGGFDEYVEDLDRFVARVREREPGRPIFVFGHSMGGAIVTLWAVTRRPDVAGLITSAPALRIDAWPMAAAAIYTFGTIAPNLGGLAPTNEHFSTDPAVEGAMARDPLIYQPPGPLGTAKGLVGGIERVWAGVDRLTMPLLLLHGTADHLTAPAGSLELYRRAPSRDKTLRLYDGLAHDLVHEPRRAEVIADVGAWIEARSGGAAATFPAPDTARRLRGQGRVPSSSLALEGGWRREVDEGAQQAGGALRMRFLLGGPVGFALGLDGDAFGGDAFTWRAAGYPVGVGLASAAGHTVSLSAGAGASDAGAGGVAFEVPVALDAELQLGPVRVLAWGRVVWLPSDDARGGGADLGDELHAGLAVRLGRHHHLWSTAGAGAGPYLGVTLDEAFDARVIGAVLGLHLFGESLGSD